MSGKKRVLIITYYWPPSGGAGVQRWLKFVKYLREFGWEPVVYTPENGEIPVVDLSLSKDVPDGVEVIKTKIWEPYSFYKRFIGAGKDEKINTGFLTEKKKPGVAEKISVWIRGNVFIPDARCFWIKPSVKFLKKYLQKNPVQAIVTSGPPHSMHMIANDLVKTVKIPWLADFRDPWTNIDYYKDLMLSKRADNLHHEMERQVITNATRVVVIGKTMQKEFVDQYKRKIDVITNGFDPDDIAGNIAVRTDKFVIAHIGTLVRSRNPEALWQALDQLVHYNTDFAHMLEIRLTGKTDISVRESIQHHGLSKFVVYTDYLPHEEVINEQQSAALLLSVLNDTPNAKGILTGKLFEYLASGRPIICIGPKDGDAAFILRESGNGQCFNFTDKNEMMNAVSKAFSRFQMGELNVTGNNNNKFSRKELTANLSQILNEMTHA